MSLNAQDLTEQQWRVLRTLSEVGAMEPNQIARSCQILSPSLTRMLAGMEEQGLIKRVRSSADQTPRPSRSSSTRRPR